MAAVFYTYCLNRRENIPEDQLAITWLCSKIISGGGTSGDTFKVMYEIP